MQSSILRNVLKVGEIEEDQILFYDVETDHQYAPYCELRMIGVKYGFNGPSLYLKTPEDLKRFKDRISDKEIIKVGFNQFNFDNIVLARHGYEVEHENCEDAYLMFKALVPDLPSYSLKFINWFYLGDPHFEEMELEAWMKRTGCKWDDVPTGLKARYLQRDLLQHCNAFRLAWEEVQKPEHWEAYQLDRSQGPIVKEMALGKHSGLLIDKQKCHEKIDKFNTDKTRLVDFAELATGGEVTNPNSSRQMGAYLDSQGFELSLSSNGKFAVRKSDLIDIREHDEIAEVAYQVRKINGTLKYFENYDDATNQLYDNRPNIMPVSVSISGARTRRYISSSLYGINFQNPNEEAKQVHLVPEGWLGVWFDSTQIENVVHIYESEDNERRASYEADPDWSEYVWLCNRILGGPPRSKKELDSISSPQIPNWSIYKQFKTAKLALNFGMGVRKFCATTGVTIEKGYETFNAIHDACPAIRSLQNRVGRDISKFGYVSDPFGHRYTGKADSAYKVVAYLIQGCGTGSVPKAHMRDNFHTIHQYDRGTFTGGSFCGTTHDENNFRLNLELSFKQIYNVLKECYYNMTEKYSYKFAGIPLRAKMYLSKTNEACHIETDINDEEQIRNIIEGKPCPTCAGAGSLDHRKTECNSCQGKGYTGLYNEPSIKSHPTREVIDLTKSRTLRKYTKFNCLTLC